MAIAGGGQLAEKLDARYSILVGMDGSATIECPGCGVIKPSLVDAFKGKRNVITVFCNCGSEFPVGLDFRKSHRMAVQFSGFMSSDNKKSWGYMKVVDLSLGGIAMQVIGQHSIVLGDKLDVEFTLDDFPASVIRKKVSVLRVNGVTLHCKFVEPPDVGDPLTRYLIS